MCVEMAYAATVLLALTVGPIYTMWREAQLNNPALPIDSAHLATFAIVQLPALFLLGKRVTISMSWKSAEWYLFALIGWLVFTSATSDIGAYAVGNAAKVALAACTGLYLAVSFTRRQQLIAITIATHMGVLISRFAIARDWPESIYESREWSGIYVNPNLLGPVAAVACVSLVFLAISFFNNIRREWRIAFLVLVFDIAVFDVVVLLRTKAFTSILATCVALGIVLFAYVVRRVIAVEKFVQVWPRLVAALSGGLVVSMVVLYRFSSLVNGKLLPRSALQERVFAWDFSWTGFLERPWLGWGQGVAWSNQIFRRLDLYWTVVNIGHSHSAYFDVLLSGGILAGVLLLTYLVIALMRISKECSSPEFDAQRIALVFFCLSAALFEPFIVANYFLWPILVMSLAVTKPNN